MVGKKDDEKIVSIILAADTVVYKDAIIGKPINHCDAENILSLLRNTSHRVATGVAIVCPGIGKRFVFYDVTEVFFKDYTNDEILDYLNTEEPWDKAGAYAIQGTWGKYIDHIEGAYDNVIGLPLDTIKSELIKSLPEYDWFFEKK